VDWHSFSAGPDASVVWTQGDISVSSVAVEHLPVDPAVAYRVDSAAGSVVVSGDTRVCSAVEHLSRGVDVLVHEVIRPNLSRAEGRAAIVGYHAEAVALGEMAARAAVGMLMLTHLEPAPETEEESQAYEDDIRRGGYQGPLIVGTDLTSFTV